jgi:hypothetical protein
VPNTPPSTDPSTSPSSSPVTAPIASDEDDEPTTCIGGGCTDDVTLKRRLGSYNATSTVDYDDMPISIISQNGETVTFEISHQWGDIELDNFFAQYMLPQGGHVCRNTNDFEEGTCVQITARCMKNNHVAVVTLTAVDPEIESTADGPSDPLPKGCCGAVNENQVLTGNVVKYIFELRCDPKDCCVENSSCPNEQKFASGFLPADSHLEKNGESCLFNEQCASCCCNTNGGSQGQGAQKCVSPGNGGDASEKKCCPFETYASTFPFGEACRAGGS